MRFCKIVVAIVVAALLALAYWQPFAEEIRAESVAKIFDDKGHGSAVYIGNGYFVSAAHVVGQEPIVNLLLTDGRKIKGDVSGRIPDTTLRSLSLDRFAMSRLQGFPALCQRLVI